MPFLPLRDTAGKVVTWARVDDCDYAVLSEWNWHLGSHGYATRTQHVNRMREDILMHRFILGLQYGDGRVVDHRNRNKLDNRRRNIWVCERADNQRNLPFKGVSYDKTRGRWQAYGRKWDGGVRPSLGYHDTRDQALAAVRRYEEQRLAA